jgi:hypothetical protein
MLFTFGITSAVVYPKFLHGGTKQNNRRPENNETFLTVTHAVLSIGLRAYRVKFDHSISFLKHQSIKQLG